MNCSACETALPDGSAFRFCPYCGSHLPDLKAQVVTDPYVAQVPVADVPIAVVSEATTRPELQALSQEVVSSEDATVPGGQALDQTRIDARPGAEATTTVRDTQEGPSPEDDPHEAPTRMELPAITEALLGEASSHAPSVANEPTIEVAPVTPRPRAVVRPSSPANPIAIPTKPAPITPAPDRDPAPSGDSSKREFSETAWFLAAVSPEQLGETEGEATSFSEQDIMTERYTPAGRLPTGLRKSFSLAPNREQSSSDSDGTPDEADSE
jgi:hypothetical protein